MNKTLKIILSLLVIVGIWYWLYYLLQNSSILWKKDTSINYSFNTKASFKIKDWSKENWFDLNIKNASIITKDNWLKQRVQLEKLDLNIIWEDNISIKNIDLVSDNQNVYLKWDFDKWEDLSNKIVEILKEWKYAKIDNSKTILDILGDFKNNELINELVTGFVTSNPQTFFEQNNIDEKLIKYLKSDELINFVFKDWDYDETTKKTSLVFNEKLCELAPIINKASSEIYGYLPLSDDKTECEEQLKQANQFLAMINIYKEWASKAGNYKFVINQWKVVDINIEYKSHNIDKWNISMAEPSWKIVLKANWNDDKIISSLLKIDIKEDWININWEIKDWEWKIDISSEKESQLSLNGFLDFKNYILENYKIEWEMNNMFIQARLLAEWNKEEWKLNITSWENYANIDYKSGIINLDIKWWEELIVKNSQVV